MHVNGMAKGQSTLLAWSTYFYTNKNGREVSKNKWKNNDHESESDSSDMSEANEVENHILGGSWAQESVCLRLHPLTVQHTNVLVKEHFSLLKSEHHCYFMHTRTQGPTMTTPHLLTVSSPVDCTN